MYRQLYTGNICTLTDSYKATHWKQYPPGTTKVYSYLESRGGKFTDTVFFGLQYILKRYLAGKPDESYGQRVTAADVAAANRLYQMHFGNSKLFNIEGWAHIVKDHEGQLPVSVKAVPEGTVVGVHNVLMTIENTCPRCFWLTNYLETLLMQVW